MSDTFSQLVCSAPPVRAAFALHSPTRLWWRVILFLHGKPTDSTLSPTAKTRRIADGFRFYALLYRSLAVVFLALAPALLALNHAADTHVFTYAAAASGLAGIALWSISGLGLEGSAAYARGDRNGTVCLLAFFVMIVGFLSAFVASASLIAHGYLGVPTLPNLAATSALYVLGIGSYFIEIVYLATAPAPGALA